MACEVGSLPTANLDLALGAKNKALEIWDGVIDRCVKRLSKWKTQYLSLGGRVVLVNSVGFSSNLCDIPFPFISQGGKKVGHSQKEFHLTRKQKAIHLVNWKTAISSKAHGGSGIRNLRKRNDSLLLSGCGDGIISTRLYGGR